MPFDLSPYQPGLQDEICDPRRRMALLAIRAMRILNRGSETLRTLKGTEVTTQRRSVSATTSPGRRYICSELRWGMSGSFPEGAIFSFRLIWGR